MPPVLLILIGCFAAYVLFKAMQPPWMLTITASPGQQPKFRGGPASKFALLSEFFSQDVELTEPVTVRVGRTAQGRLIIRVSGNLHRGTQQRIRNFLLEHL